MVDINNLIRELDGLVLSLTSASRTGPSERRFGLFGIDVSLSIRPLDLEGPTGGTKQYGKEPAEPLVDVIDGKDTIRVIALLPGIRSEDVRYSIGDGYLELEISNGATYRRRILCSARPEEVSVKSATVNNSVLEIVFSKK